MSFELKLLEPLPSFNILDSPYEDKMILDSDGHISKTKTGKERKMKGYSGKAKGLAQVFWERGLWKTRMKKELNIDDNNFLDLCARTTLDNCHDFREKIGAMENLVLSRSHTCLFSPKGYPEIAGVGIEYNWGVSKIFFRKENKDVPKYYERDIRSSLDNIGINIAFNTSRRARTYMKAYTNDLSDL